ncbi:MAG: hypothetical protein GX033_08360 [Firmicutes bacterium]|nr:hypothetical protein [Bacillota bacterium]
MFSDTRYKVVVLSLLLLLIALAMWFIWSNSVDRIPQGGILVMQTDGDSIDGRLVHPYYSIATRRVMV